MTTYSHGDHQALGDGYRDHTQDHYAYVPRQRGDGDGTEPDGERAHDDAFSLSRQYDRYGGLNWGAAFFGAVVAAGVTLILGGALGAVLVASGTDALANAERSPRPVIIGAAGVVFGILVASSYAGGYVAGRMSRFDGARQGFGVFVMGLMAALLAGGGGLLAEAELNLLHRLDVTAATGLLDSPALWAVATGATFLIGTLLSAVTGGKVGVHYHRKVDEAGYL